MKFNQERHYVGKYQIGLIHEYKYLRMDFYLLEYFEPSNKRQQRNCRYKSSMLTLRKEEIIRFMYIYSKFWSCQLLHVVQRCRGKIWKNLIEGFWKRHEDTYDEIYKVHITICFKKRTRQ